jgi:hypothetical protein
MLKIFVFLRFTNLFCGGSNFVKLFKVLLKFDIENGFFGSSVSNIFFTLRHFFI